MKRLFIVSAVVISCLNSNAQNGCASNLSSTLINGPDSIYTDADQTFRSLTVNPYNENHVMIGSEGSGVFSSRDGGLTWKWQRNGFKHYSADEYAETWGLAYDLSDTSVIFAATTNSPGPITGNYPSAMAGVYKSSDGGKSWAQKNCGLPNSKIASVWADSNTVVISVSGEEPSFSNPPQAFYTGGIYYSDDKGENWVKAATNVNMDSVQCWRITQRGNTLYTIGVALNKNRCSGFLRSTDRGKTWHTLANPLSKRIIANYGISKDGKKIIAAVRDSFFVYITEDEGVHWTKLNIPINGHVSIHPQSADTVFFSDWSNLKKSTVDMHTGDINSSDYHLVLSQNKYIESMLFAPSNPNTIYLATRDYRVFKSTDGGDNFTQMVRLRDVMRAAQNQTSLETNAYSSVSIYPNPSVDGKFIVNHPNEESIAIKVFDLLSGKILYTNDYFNDFQLDLSMLSAGMYSLEINNNSTYKIVVVR